MLISRKTMETIELIDESYFMYIEDLDYCYRAKKAGIKMAVLHKSKIWHKTFSVDDLENKREKNVQYFSFAVYWATKNRIKFISNNFSGFPKVLLLFFFLVSKLFTIFKYLLKNRKDISIAQIKGLRDGLKECILK